MLVKKYANRRLYDTDASRYITLDELAERVRQGADPVVIDAADGTDLTQATLVQVIFESRGGGKLLPVPLLVQLVRMQDAALAEFFGRWVHWALDAYVRGRQGIQWLQHVPGVAPWFPYGSGGAPGAGHGQGSATGAMPGWPWWDGRATAWDGRAGPATGPSYGAPGPGPAGPGAGPGPASSRPHQPGPASVEFGPGPAGYGPDPAGARSDGRNGPGADQDRDDAIAALRHELEVLRAGVQGRRKRKPKM